jgi:hypothetical protein
MQSVGTRVVVEGIQRCFCINILKFEKNSTKVGMTQN